MINILAKAKQANVVFYHVFCVSQCNVKFSLTVHLDFKLVWLKGIHLNRRRISKLRKLCQGISQVLLTITIYTLEEIFLLMEGIIFY